MVDVASVVSSVFIIPLAVIVVEARVVVVAAAAVPLPKIPSNVEEDKDWLAADFSSGYIQRAKHLFPKQGNKAPWKNYQNYIKDWFDIKYNKLQDPSMKFYSK